MAGINEEVKVTEGVFGGISMGDNGIEESVLNTGNNLPAKTGFWSKLKSVLFYEVKVELTPYQQKVEDEIKELKIKWMLKGIYFFVSIGTEIKDKIFLFSTSLLTNLLNYKSKQNIGNIHIKTKV